MVYAAVTVSTQSDWNYCGGYNTGCGTTSCCIYVSDTYCGQRISVNSQICVPKASKIAKGDMIGLNPDSANRISIVLKTANTLPTTVYAAQACGDSYYMS